MRLGRKFRALCQADGAGRIPALPAHAVGAVVDRVGCGDRLGHAFADILFGVRLDVGTMQRPLKLEIRRLDREGRYESVREIKGPVEDQCARWSRLKSSCVFSMTRLDRDMTGIPLFSCAVCGIERRARDEAHVRIGASDIAMSIRATSCFGMSGRGCRSMAC
jgi:hypothetical protein